jgi:cholesterol oxidase
MRRHYDVVIVGSGFGGSIAACRLARARKPDGSPVSVCVLERGKRYHRGEFPRDVARTKEWWWRNGGRNGWKGLLEFRSFNNASILCASGVGGTSLVYLDVQVNAFPSSFEARGEKGRRWPRLDGREWKDELQPYYLMLERALRPTPIPDPTVKTRALKAAADAVGEGHRFRLLDLAIYWGGRGVLVDDPYGDAGPPQAGCRYCGECYIGCNTHSKNTMDLTYLWHAERAGAEVYSQHNVSAIEPNGPDHPAHPGGYTVHYEDLRWGGFSGRVSGQTLIVAAGTMGTAELMLRAQRGYKSGRQRIDPSLPNLSPMLGQYFSGNGDFGAAAFETNRETNPMIGPTITAAIDHGDNAAGGFLIEDGGFPDVLRAYLRRFPGGIAFGRRILGAFRDLLGRDENRKLVEGVFAQLDFETIRDCLPFLVMGQDAADGKMGLDEEGCLTIDWTHEKSLSFFREIENTVRRISETRTPGLDGNAVFAPTWSIGKNLVTVHPLGGCAMGKDADHGVVSSFGEVYNYRNLYILDGSIVPSAIGPNPSKTIGALAERGAAHIIQQKFRPASSPTSAGR